MLAHGMKWPLTNQDRKTFKYTETVVHAYTHEEVNALMAVADRDQKDLLQFLLCTGMREREAEFACWTELHAGDLTFDVKEKTDFPQYEIKDHEERTIPIPPELVMILQERRKRYPGTRLIFPARKGGPEGHLLRRLKDLAFKAGLNCGHCVKHYRNKKTGTVTTKRCDEHPICSTYKLHTFRKTFATRHHENNATLQDLQRWLGHANIETTQRYLARSDDHSERCRTIVNSTFKFALM
jgi:integrase/recombinase XerD